MNSTDTTELYDPPPSIEDLEKKILEYEACTRKWVNKERDISDDLEWAWAQGYSYAEFETSSGSHCRYGKREFIWAWRQGYLFRKMINKTASFYLEMMDVSGLYGIKKSLDQRYSP
jgi:hypothetical protein